MLHLNESYSDSPPAQKVPSFIEVKGGKVVNITEEIALTIFMAVQYYIHFTKMSYLHYSWVSMPLNPWISL
jgi:hypothetical protein